MAGYDRQIITGDPGTTWTNDTGKARYQFIASLVNTCGTCLQYHMQIGPFWGIPIHHGCRCRQAAVAPGAQAPHPFVDYRALLDGMPPDQQRAAIGASCYKLLDAGVIEWKDVVTSARVRSLREVVALKKLSVKAMTGAGVGRIWAERAYESVHTAAHEIAAQQRAQAAAAAQAAGMTAQQLADELAKRLGARLGVQTAPTEPGGEPGVQRFRSRGSSAAELAKLLVSPGITLPAVRPKPKPKPPEEPPAAAAAEPQPPPKPPWQPGAAIEPDRPIGERIAGDGPHREKLAAIVGADRNVADLNAGIKARENEYIDEMARLRATGKPLAERLEMVRPFDERLNAAILARDAARAAIRERIDRILDLPENTRAQWQHADGAGKAHWKSGAAAQQASAAAREWLESKLAAGGSAPINVQWDARAGVRAFANESQSRIMLDARGSAKTAAHELGHHVEYRVPGVLEAAREFLAHRTQGEPLQSLRKVLPGRGYKSTERGREDKWREAFGDQAWYVGKHYDHATEIISMGVEKLYDDPVGFARADPEYCAFIIGILDGSMRKP